MGNIWLNIKRIFTLENCIVRGVTSWCLVSIVQTLIVTSKGGNLVDSLESQGNVNFWLTLFSVAFIMALLFFAFELLGTKKSDVNKKYAKKADGEKKERKFYRGKGLRLVENVLLFAVVLLYAVISVYYHQDMYFAMGVIALMALVVAYCLKEADLSQIHLNKYLCGFGIALAGGLFVAFVAACAVCRYEAFYTPNFDFGIFSQMFYNMKEHFNMNTTCERDVLMSHMQVHISPVYWLVLPIYMVFPTPATLQVMQAVVIALGLLPLNFICRHNKLSRVETLLVSICYAAYPVISAGTFYDFHENAFLPVALLLLLMYVEKDNSIGMVLSALFVLSVKEDAAIYLAFVALYCILSKKMYKKGFAMLAVSVVWFLGAVAYINTAGQGTLTFRFNNMIYEGDSNVFGMIKTVVNSPAYFVTQVFRQENLEFILKVFAPLLFLPFFSKKWQRFILFGPLVLINLMADYTYGNDINYHYVLGSGALLIYMTIKNMAEFKQSIRQKLVVMLPIASLLMFVALNWGQTRYIKKCVGERGQDIVSELDAALELIPDDASVKATTFLCPKLSQREELYELYYSDKETDYVVIDLRIDTGYTERNAHMYEYTHSEKYEQVYYEPLRIAIFKKK